MGPEPTTVNLALPAALEAEIDALVAHYPVKRSASLMVLHALQEHFGYLSRDAIEWTARKLELEPIHVLELVTFYPMFHSAALGRFHFRICRTLSCALGGSWQLYERLCQKLGLDSRAHGAQTTADGRVTLEWVECLANCHQAPVVMLNEACLERVTPEQVDALLDQCK